MDEVQKEGAEGGLIDDHFDDKERTDLKAAFERKDFGALQEQLVKKGITAEGDRQEILEALAGGKTEVAPEDLRETLSDLYLSEGHLPAGSPARNAEIRDAEDASALLARVMAHATGEPAMPSRGWRLNMAILLVAMSLRASGVKVTKAQFREMVRGTYKGLEGLK